MSLLLPSELQGKMDRLEQDIPAAITRCEVTLRDYRTAEVLYDRIEAKTVITLKATQPNISLEVARRHAVLEAEQSRLDFIVAEAAYKAAIHDHNWLTAQYSMLMTLIALEKTALQQQITFAPHSGHTKGDEKSCPSAC